mgnify:CR=1 FL=1|jgi:formylmethanofuran dehydrogenase subunit E
MGNRITQHRQQRETEAREKADLKRENKALRKQLTRLRRQIQKLVETHGSVEQMAAEVAEPIAVKEGGSPTGGCEKCGSLNIARITIPSGTLVACKDCTHRKKEPRVK